MTSHRVFLKNSIIITIGTVAGGVLSYVFSAVMGRMLGPSKFGDLGAINSVFAIITSLGTAVLTVSMHYTGQLHSLGDFAGITWLYKKFSQSLFKVGLVLAVALFILAPALARFFSITDPLAFGIALTAILFSLLTMVNRGILQGSQRFAPLSISNVVEIGLKLVIAIILVMLGLSLRGAALAIVLSLAGTYVYTYQSIKHFFLPKPTKPETIVPNKAEVLYYSLPTLLCTFLLLLAMNMDVILVKRFFDPVSAGQYIAVSTIAKIIFYITGPISSVMFPMITERRSKGEKHYQTLVFALLFTLLTSAILISAYYLLDQKIVVSLYGAQYQRLSALLPESSWLVIGLSLVSLMSNYFMSIKQFVFVYFFAFLLLLEAVYIQLHHASLLGVIRSLQIGSAALFGMMVVNYLFIKRTQIIALFTTNNE